MASASSSAPIASRRGARPQRSNDCINTAVQGEREQRGVVEVAGDPFGLARLAPPRSRSPRDSSAIVASSGARAASGNAAGSARRAAATILAACSGSSERVQIAGTS